MHKRWLMICLAFSVAVNIAAISTLAYFWFSGPQHRDMPDFRKWRSDKTRPWLDDKKDEIDKDRIRKFFESNKGIWEKQKEKRLELIKVMQQAEPDTMRVMQIIDDLGAQQIILEKNVARNMLQDSVSRAHFIKMFEFRLEPRRFRSDFWDRDGRRHKRENKNKN